MPNKISLNNDFPSIKESDKLYNRAQGLIPSFTQTLAKGPGQWVKGIAPKYLIRDQDMKYGTLLGGKKNRFGIDEIVTA